ncbi:hypothetical protein K435DRAFT_793195 [Dendrothele bispora CBS 962.96]|uniref:Uncharacterized protein n=1 Tax=Dendrothele bispora (strain CBS 962.96) TaxID=1314807 RepID=A0A4S8MHE4_DENBC|nr:hypothetical protein K435DRAFT_793195 [Dendrothele bispora CBS 962.96]
MHFVRRITLENPEYPVTVTQVKKENAQTVLKYVEPANSMSLDQEQIMQYDLSEVSKLVCPFHSHPEKFPLILALLLLTQLHSVYIGIAMMAFLHVSNACTTPQARNGPRLWAESLEGTVEGWWCDVWQASSSFQFIRHLNSLLRFPLNKTIAAWASILLLLVSDLSPSLPLEIL